MCIPKGEEIGAEIHRKTSQFIRVESGRGQAVISGKVHKLKKDFAVLVPYKIRPNKQPKLKNEITFG
jgi:mannose-6-phosphate isomerase-like protein (cupin superfamily)